MTIWKLQPSPVTGKERIAPAHPQWNSHTDREEFEYFASIKVWGRLDHRLTEFLPVMPYPDK